MHDFFYVKGVFQILYLDHCATTPPHEEVIHTITDVMRRFYGNPSSLHRLGFEAEQVIKRSREIVALTMSCKTDEIIFTSGGTESNNLAIKGAALAFQHRGKHLITSEIEHPSVYDSFKLLEQSGFRVTYLPVDKTGQVLLDDVKNALCDDTILVSLMHINNEMGRIQPVEQVGQLLRSYPRILFHVDAIQSIGKLPIAPREMGIDLLSGSAHKFHGPKGIGFLYRREGIVLQPQLSGGGQEFGLRSGTENVPLIAGMAKAMQTGVGQFHTTQQTEKLYQLRSRLVDRLERISGLSITGSSVQQDMAPQLVHFTLPDLKPEIIVHSLEQHQVYISTRSACASDSTEPSRVLKAMGMDRQKASSGLRVSFSASQTEADIDYFADRLELVLSHLEGLKRRRRD